MKLLTASLLLLSLVPLRAAAPQSAALLPTKGDVIFAQAAVAALDTMRSRAGELNTSGVAVVAFIPGDSLQSWTSRMVVVGRYKDLPSATDKGANLLGIAYAKASEMADTLKDSGSQVRPPMTGEFGWQGGVIVHDKAGYLIAAFSGGKSEDDLAISRAGLAKLKGVFTTM